MAGPYSCHQEHLASYDPLGRTERTACQSSIIEWITAESSFNAKASALLISTLGHGLEAASPRVAVSSKLKERNSAESSGIGSPYRRYKDPDTHTFPKST